MARVARDETGAALVVVVLLMLGLLALAHGVLVASLAELAGSRAAVRDLEARAAAERGVQAALAVAPGPWMDSLRPWESKSVWEQPQGPVEAFGTVRRLDAESFLVEGAGRFAGGMGARSALLAWSLDPLTSVMALPAVVSVGSGAQVTINGTIEGGDPTVALPPLPPGACDPWLDALVRRYQEAPLPAVASAQDTAAFPRLGLLDLEALLEMVTITVSGTGTPVPDEASGACLVDEPWVWGDPDQPARPCGAHLPLRGAGGDLRMDGGVGQGLLIVDGDVTLASGARYFGMIITRGAIRLEGGSTFEGMALAADGLDVAAGATLGGSACWATRAVAAQKEVLQRLMPLKDVGRIGPL